jgi:hypothetical protein
MLVVPIAENILKWIKYFTVYRTVPDTDNSLLLIRGYKIDFQIIPDTAPNPTLQQDV